MIILNLDCGVEFGERLESFAMVKEREHDISLVAVQERYTVSIQRGRTQHGKDSHFFSPGRFTMCLRLTAEPEFR